MNFHKETYIMTTDTRTEAERRYDAERDGSAYVQPDAQRELGRYDAERDGMLYTKPSALPLEDERAIAEWIDRRAAPAIGIRRIVTSAC
jgi:hypothetical protein